MIKPIMGQICLFIHLAIGLDVQFMKHGVLLTLKFYFFLHLHQIFYHYLLLSVY